MKRILLGILVVGIILFTSCSARVKSNINTSRYSEGTNYYQDVDTKAVFAIVVIKTGINAQEDGVGIAYIPKSEVNQAIKDKIKNYKEQ